MKKDITLKEEKYADKSRAQIIEHGFYSKQ